jgi:hypothetical protein
MAKPQYINGLCLMRANRFDCCGTRREPADNSQKEDAHHGI